jgi:hypothetical protein
MDQFWIFLKSDGGRVTLAVIAILVPVVVATTLYFKNRRRKQLVYEILSKTRVLTVKEEISGRIRIFLDEEQVQDVGLVHIRITNVGTEPIRTSEFVRPISFSVPEGARIINADIVKKEPEALDATIQKEDTKATLVPALLNGGDTFTFKLLIANFDGKIVPDARIEGAELERRESRRKINLGQVLYQTLAAFAGVTFAAALEKSIGTNVTVKLPAPSDAPNDYE